MHKCIVLAIQTCRHIHGELNVCDDQPFCDFYVDAIQEIGREGASRLNPSQKWLCDDHVQDASSYGPVGLDAGIFDLFLIVIAILLFLTS